MPRIPDVPQPDGAQRFERTEPKRSQRAAGAESTAGSVGSADRVELSDDARQLETVKNRLAEEARNQPDVREDRVAQAKARLEAGEYEGENVKRVIADRILEQLGL